MPLTSACSEVLSAVRSITVCPTERSWSSAKLSLTISPFRPSSASVASEPSTQSNVYPLVISAGSIPVR